MDADGEASSLPALPASASAASAVANGASSKSSPGLVAVCPSAPRQRHGRARQAS
jgi:hypothetical protein